MMQKPESGTSINRKYNMVPNPDLATIQPKFEELALDCLSSGVQQKRALKQYQGFGGRASASKWFAVARLVAIPVVAFFLIKWWGAANASHSPVATMGASGAPVVSGIPFVGAITPVAAVGASTGTPEPGVVPFGYGSKPEDNNRWLHGTPFVALPTAPPVVTATPVVPAGLGHQWVLPLPEQLPVIHAILTATAVAKKGGK